MHPEFIGFIVFNRQHGVIRADQGAHGASDAGMRRIGFLPNAVINTKAAGRRIGKSDFGCNRSFPMHPEFDGVYRANRGAPAAQGALIPVPHDLPE
jgi:hypothetical protein